MLTQQERQMRCASPEMSNESAGLAEDDPFSTHSAAVDAPARERAARVFSP